MGFWIPPCRSRIPACRSRIPPCRSRIPACRSRIPGAGFQILLLMLRYLCYGFRKWISANEFRIHCLAGFWIRRAGFSIAMPSISDFTSKKFLDSGIRITLHGAKQISRDKCYMTICICEYTSNFVSQINVMKNW